MTMLYCMYVYICMTFNDKISVFYALSIKLSSWKEKEKGKIKELTRLQDYFIKQLHT